MKKTLILPLVFLLVFTFSCKEQSLDSKVSGSWIGETEVEIFYTDSLSNSISQSFIAPIKLVYDLDSSVHASISPSESLIYDIVAKSFQIDSMIKFSGNISVDMTSEFLGNLKLINKNELEYNSTSFSTNKGGTTVSKISAILSREF